MEWHSIHDDTKPVVLKKNIWVFFYVTIDILIADKTTKILQIKLFKSQYFENILSNRNFNDANSLILDLFWIIHVR